MTAAAYAEAPRNPDTFVELENVTLTYGRGEKQIVALRPYQLARSLQGDFVALVGPSGCGKSTILKLVTGLITASDRLCLCRRPRGRRRAGAGRHGVPEPDHAAVANSARQRHAAAQDRAAVPRRNIATKRKTEFRDRADALLKEVGLAPFGDKYPWQLSGGMLQRASLCRALVHEPQLLMLDEPFGALDQFTREELWAIMQELWMKLKPTVLLVTHDLKEAGYLANRICVMRTRPGQIIDDAEVPFPRPRTIEMSYLPDFVTMTQRLRQLIVSARPVKETVQ